MLYPATLIVFLLTCSTATLAQVRGSGEVSPFQIGSATINLGVGVGAAYDNQNAGFGFKAAGEFGLWQAGPGVISLGPEIGLSVSNNRYLVYDDFHARTFIVAGRGAWHYGWGVPGLDTYGGASFGIGFHHYEYKNPDFSDNTVLPVFGVFVGASYFLTPQFGFNAEAGYDITNFQVGVVMKLPR